jgi:hypothetical protein
MPGGLAVWAFFTGRVTWSRFRVNGPPPGMFDADYLQKLAAYQAGRARLAAADGVELGWLAGDHILDTRFDLAKNIVNDTLHFVLRIDIDKIPADLLRAYYQVELEAAAANNPSGRPSARQKREAKEAARERLEEQAKDGRFRRRKAIEVLWDAQANELLFGTTASGAIDQLYSLFEQTFDRKLEQITAGKQAHALAEARALARNVDDAQPTVYLPGLSPTELAWVLDETSRDFLGNEFLLWLWWTLDVEGDTLKLADGSEATAMLARTLTLECPRGQTGRESISSDGPTRLPEAKRAIQSGKLPRKVGITVVRHDQQYELTLQAETLSVSGAKLPPVEGDELRVRLEERVNQLRHLIETLDLLYDAFIQQRCTSLWAETTRRIQKWLQ